MADSIRAWHPSVPGLREVLHASFDDHAYPMHAHDDWAVLLIDSGAVAYELDRGRHHALPDAVTILPPGVPHDGRSATKGAGFRKRVLYFESAWLPESAPSAAAVRPTLDGADVLEAVRAIHDALTEPAELLEAEHAALVLQDRVLERLHAPADAPADAPLARRLRDLLEGRVQEAFTIADAAAQLGAHPSHMTRAFTHAYGMPPHRYLISRRVDHARRLLVDGWRVADAAASAGFHDQAHLTRHFRRILGTTPARFKAGS
ncbi:helix-turn-helix transcriptional regulator [Microbacterium murale]|uniref:AraC-like DNA-binding protein n=1 Tax=Microbacterium murale TaxID=1081040 RepID=A0ABU0PED1_9MICO|nr:AraC family transcriptional regulator [Microbacterium murale]MDQ0645675.1 AraC-like DNA-binding protein [Microbacterium murale]